MVHNRLITVLLGLCLAMGCMAQEAEQPSVPTNYWTQNWFVELGVGGEILFSPNATIRSFGERISPAVNVIAGKWLTPYIGARLQVKGFQMLGARDATGIYLNNPIAGNTLFGNDDPVRNHVTIAPNGTYKVKYYYQNTHLDLMVSVMNLVYGGYDSEHHWDVIPTVGMGYMTVFPYRGTPTGNVMTTNFGVQGKYRINSNWDVNLSVQYAVFSDCFDSRFVGKKYSGNMDLTASVTYNIYGHQFKKSTPIAVVTDSLKKEDVKSREVVREVVSFVYDTVKVMDTVRVVDTIRVITTTSQMPISENRTGTTAVDPNFVSNSLGYILFNLGETTPSEAFELQCINTASYLKAHPTKKVILYGYADRETGTDEVNLKVSKQRVEFVQNVLVNTYGVDRDSIVLAPMGSGEQPYAKSGLNRLVVIKIGE